MNYSVVILDGIGVLRDWGFSSDGEQVDRDGKVTGDIDLYCIFVQTFQHLVIIFVKTENFTPHGSLAMW